MAWLEWSNPVAWWWVFLSSASVVNIAAWFWLRYYRFSGVSAITVFSFRRGNKKYNLVVCLVRFCLRI